MARLIRFSCVAVSLFYSLLAFAQSPQPQTYGTQDEIALVLQSSAFTPMNSTITYGGDIVRFVTNNNGCCLVAPVSLPSGASVIGIEVQGCDNSATAGITSVFTACDLTNCTGLSQYVSTPANSGCGRF